MKGDRNKGVDGILKSVVVMVNHDFRLGKEGREDISERVIVKMW